MTESFSAATATTKSLVCYGTSLISIGRKECFKEKRYIIFIIMSLYKEGVSVGVSVILIYFITTKCEHTLHACVIGSLHCV